MLSSTVIAGSDGDAIGGGGGRKMEGESREGGRKVSGDPKVGEGEK